ncbi:MAG: hypothetical protein OXH70_07310 [Acidobacteria bacterium]|nr:hypothetical protein [Acidobacteriota bacterium]
MRKDSWFRGPLLSVLFFGLLPGPGGGLDTGESAAFASPWGGVSTPESCAQNGGYWKYTGYPHEKPTGYEAAGYCQSHSEYCEEYSNDLLAMGGSAGVAGSSHRYMGMFMAALMALFVLDYLNECTGDNAPGS